jgi:16S rRNA (guanine966-N2)-methyltransferase
MIRVIQGKHKGRGIPSPSGKSIRPTTALLRESIFNRFQFKIKQARFLDLFAGSGIMGLEALSRGAQFALLVERDTKQSRLIREYFASINITEEEAKIIHYCARDLIAKPCQSEPFDIIFMDPPYGFSKLSDLASRVERNGWVKPDGVILVEQSARDEYLEGFEVTLYGTTALLIKQLPS